MGVATRAMSKPLGRVQRASSRPTGSGSAATSAAPCAIASMRSPSSRKRSSSAGDRPRASPARMSSSLAARILSLSARMALEAASKALFFDSVEASRSTTAATRARSPMACISASSVRAPVMEGVRFIGRLQRCRSAPNHRDGSSRRGHDSREWFRSRPCGARPRGAPPRHCRRRGHAQVRARWRF